MWNISCCSNTLTSRKSASWLKLTRYLRLGHPSQGEAFPSVELAQVAAAPVRGPGTGHRARSCGQSQEQQREAQEPRHLLKPESDLWSLPDEKKRKEKEKKNPLFSGPSQPQKASCKDLRSESCQRVREAAGTQSAPSSR